MNPEAQKLLPVDCDGLREIFAGLNRLEEELSDARTRVAARQRGYFTPDEDDRVRGMLLVFRNYRLVLHEIIDRYQHYEDCEEIPQRWQAFLIGFAAALTLYSKSLKLIQTYEHEPLVRKKLNEPDAKFELAEGFFDEILRSYSSLGNYRQLAHANRFWRNQRQIIQKWVFGQPPEWAWLAGIIRHERVVVRKRFVAVLNARFRYDWRMLVETTIKPMRQTRYRFQSLIGGTFAGARTTLHYRPGLTSEVFSALRPQLQPGDVLLVRAEQKLTSALLPGFWAHAAIFLGGQQDLLALDLQHHPHVQKHWDRLPADGGTFGQVIESVSPRVAIHPLEKSLFADHVAVLRPNVSRAEMSAALAEAFGHLDKPYDFEFDFNVTTRVVCTELIYRCFHRRSGIEFPLVKRLGRFTLTGDDIMNLALNGLSRSGMEGSPFQIVSLVLKKTGGQAEFIAENKLLHTLRSIQTGWRPAQPAQPEKLAHA